MLYVEETQMVKTAGEQVIPSEARRECEEIMNRIYAENPSYFPYGLNVAGHDGGLWMIREASTGKAVGFTGWQERRERRNPGAPLEKVGYYSIGVLPEYRGNGYARAAVSQLLRMKSASVDRVQAFIVAGNSPSMGLARSLRIPVVHDA